MHVQNYKNNHLFSVLHVIVPPSCHQAFLSFGLSLIIFHKFSFHISLVFILHLHSSFFTLYFFYIIRIFTFRIKEDKGKQASNIYNSFPPYHHLKVYGQFSMTACKPYRQSRANIGFLFLFFIYCISCPNRREMCKLRNYDKYSEIYMIIVKSNLSRVMQDFMQRRWYQSFRISLHITVYPFRHIQHVIVLLLIGRNNRLHLLKF